MESLGENSYFGHAYFLHDAMARVPFIIKYPEGLRKMETVDYKVNTIDITRLILTWANDEGTLWPNQRNIVFSEAYGIADNALKYWLGSN